ncbi:hypothetical protein ACN2CC_33640 [Mesorhizobium muleiense]|uniref:hypothetical protein n=1 Tax=Mesorhizobium muleiense TaxID=1004279 RepID=UPI003AFB46C7
MKYSHHADSCCHAVLLAPTNGTGKPGTAPMMVDAAKTCPRDAVWRLLSHPHCAECYVADKRPRWSGALHGGRTLPIEVLPINISDYIAVQL